MHAELKISNAVQTEEICSGSHLDASVQAKRQARSLGQTGFIPAGQNIYMQDDPARYFFRLINGTISTSLVTENGDRRVTGFLSEGDYFGSIFSDRYRTSAEAITDCTIVCYGRRQLSSKDVSNSTYGQIVLDALANELRVAEDHVLLLGGVTTCARVAAFLLYLSKRAAQRGEHENPISIPMTRYHIADFLGTTSESVSRCLTKLKQAGVIRMNAPDMITLVDRCALSEIPRGY